MRGRNHGRRYSFSEKKEILDYLENHTYKEACTKYGISEPTLSRWRQTLKSERKKNRAKLTITLPKFWLEYVNEQINLGIWKDQSNAILKIIRYYFRHQKSIQNSDLKYLENVKELIPNLLKLNPNIDSLLLSSSNEVIYKTERWESTEGIRNLIENWKKASSGKLKEFEFQNETYYIRDISVKHLIAVKKNQRVGYLLGLKKKLTENDVYILAKAKKTNDSSLLLAMNTLKKTAMGVLPTISEEPRDKSFKVSKETPPEDEKSIMYWLKELYRKPISRTHREMALKEREKIFQIKMDPSLMRLVEKVNMPLKLEEKEVLDALEKQLGKNIERITADPEQETSSRELWKISWLNPEISIPPLKFPCHYMAFNGKIRLVVLLNLGLSEIPSEISNLKNLTYLCLNSNNITELPKTFSNLKSLETLYLDNNQITMIPDSIIELQKLECLSIRNNKISQIPVALTERKMGYLHNLNFSGNQIEHSSLSKEQLELERKLILYV